MTIQYMIHLPNNLDEHVKQLLYQDVYENIPDALIFPEDGFKSSNISPVSILTRTHSWSSISCKSKPLERYTSYSHLSYLNFHLLLLQDPFEQSYLHILSNHLLHSAMVCTSVSHLFAPLISI